MNNTTKRRAVTVVSIPIMLLLLWVAATEPKPHASAAAFTPPAYQRTFSAPPAFLDILNSFTAPLYLLEVQSYSGDQYWIDYFYPSGIKASTSSITTSAHSQAAPRTSFAGRSYTSDLLQPNYVVVSDSTGELGRFKINGDSWTRLAIDSNGLIYILAKSGGCSCTIEEYAYPAPPQQPYTPPPLRISPGKPAILIASADGEAPAKYDLPVASSGAPVCNPATGTMLRVGTVTATCFVTDRYDQVASTSFTITVLPWLVLDDLPDIAAVADKDGHALVNFDPPHASAGSPTCDQAPGYFPIGVTEVTCSVAADFQTRSTSFHIVVSPGPGSLVFDPPVIKLVGLAGSVVMGSTVLRNVGTAPSLIASLDQADSPTLAVGTVSADCLGSILPPGGSCGVFVSYETPVGQQEVFLNAKGQRGEVAQLDVEVNGLLADLTLTPGTISFGSTTVNELAPSQTLLAENSGDVALTVGVPSLSGDPDFNIESTSCGSTLLPAKSCSIEIDARATRTGNRTGILTLSGVPLGGRLPIVKHASLDLLGAAISTTTSSKVSTSTTSSLVSSTTTTSRPTPQSTTTVTMSRAKSDGLPTPSPRSANVQGAVISGTSTTGHTEAGRVSPASVTPSRPTLPTLPPPISPIVTFDPPVGQLGRVTYVIGRNFSANAELKIYWSKGGRLKAVGGGHRTIQTNSSGEFRIPVLVLLYSDLGLQRFSILNSNSEEVAGKAFLAVAPTYRPFGPSQTRLRRRLIRR